jgi:GNAT superfamily N-acetyltransferase
METTIRKATFADLPTIRTIAHQTWPVTFGSILSPDQINYMLEWMYSIQSLEKQVNGSGHIFLLAFMGDQKVGYASYELNYEREKQTKLHKLYVLPEMQGKRVGKRLLDEVKEIARQATQQQLLLNVNRDNKAVQFYGKLGFTVIKEVDIPIGDGFYMRDYILNLDLQLIT